MRQRLDYIDIAKGIGIILVVCSHTIYPELMYYTSAFFVPVFFFCSGFTSSKKEIGIKENFIRHALKLLKPYLVFSILLMLFFHDFSLRAIFGIFYSRYCLYPFGTEPDIVHFMIVGNYPMWFLTCMVVAYLLYEIILYYPKYQYHLATVYLIAAILMQYLPILLPWSIDTAPLMAIIIYYGTQVRKYFPDIFSSRVPNTLVIISLVTYLLLIPFCQDINISVREYGTSIFTYLLAALTGSILVTWLSRLIQGTIIGKGLQQIGIHSLTIFCIEIPFILWGKQLPMILFRDLPQQSQLLATAITQIVVSIAGGYLISLLLHQNKHIRNIVFNG